MSEYGDITEKQQQILDYIKEQIVQKGFPPSVRDICSAVNLRSTSSVHSYLEKLEKNGYIKRDKAKSRSIEIVDDDFNEVRKEMAFIPELGEVAAGSPMLAVENTTGYFPIPTEYLSNRQTFILKVKGDSMIDIGILNGDKIIVEQTNVANNGDIVVALVDDSATVKRFYKEEDHVRLQPENKDMEPIIVDNCSILGKVVGLFRFDIH